MLFREWLTTRISEHKINENVLNIEFFHSLFPTNLKEFWWLCLHKVIFTPNSVILNLVKNVYDVINCRKFLASIIIFHLNMWGTDRKYTKVEKAKV